MQSFTADKDHSMFNKMTCFRKKIRWCLTFDTYMYIAVLLKCHCTVGLDKNGFRKKKYNSFFLKLSAVALQ